MADFKGIPYPVGNMNSFMVPTWRIIPGFVSCLVIIVYKHINDHLEGVPQHPVGAATKPFGSVKVVPKKVEDLSPFTVIDTFLSCDFFESLVVKQKLMP